MEYKSYFLYHEMATITRKKGQTVSFCFQMSTKKSQNSIHHYISNLIKDYLRFTFLQKLNIMSINRKCTFKKTKTSLINVTIEKKKKIAAERKFSNGNTFWVSMLSFSCFYFVYRICGIRKHKFEFEQIRGVFIYLLRICMRQVNKRSITLS